MSEDDLLRVMVVMAHPDDAEFTVAGTVAKWAQEGREVIYVICTDGSRGSNDPGMPPERLAPIREAEQRAAAQVLGVKETVFLGYEDGTLQPTLELRRDITRAIRRYRPDIVICSDPTMRYHDNHLNHPDHRAAADAALDAVFPSASTRWIFPELLEEGLEPYTVKEVYISGSRSPDLWVDISQTIGLKIAALKKHESQVGDWDDLEEFIKGWNEETGREQGMAYAEAFKRVDLRR